MILVQVSLFDTFPFLYWIIKESEKVSSGIDPNKYKMKELIENSGYLHLTTGKKR